MRCAEVHESFINYGEGTQSIESLLSILIGNQDKVANIVEESSDIVGEIRNKKYSDFLYKGLSKSEAQKISAAIELGKRIASYHVNSKHITSPKDTYEYMSFIKDETHEMFYVILLNTKNRVIKSVKISEGSLSSSVVHPREVFAEACINHAASMIVAHNHPSGDPFPSSEDRNLTDALVKGAEVLGINFLDHIVIGCGKYYSFKEHGDF